MLGMHRSREVCGCYFVVDYQRNYLPQVAISSHTIINPVSFTTNLTQRFSNTSENKLDRVRYAFPLYDGVAVCGYTIEFAGRTLKGVVKQKDDAKKTYQAAVNRGETAGLLEALPAGVFGVTLGNMPPKTDVLVNITYCGELKHDAAIDGLRYTLPTSIAPRYGAHPGHLLASNTESTGGIKITIDIDMGKSAVRRVQSPSHPIAVTMGELSTADHGPSSPPNPSQSSASLTQGSAELGSDFILQLSIDDVNKPQAIVEIHPTLPNHRAIMATLVPQFTLPSANPEIVFIADQSGSMRGPKNSSLVAALKVFLKSLPLGVRFNICAFGSKFQFLWSQSQAYNEDNLDTAMAFVGSLQALFGGTEILAPIQEAFQRHLTDLPLEIMLLTDGEIWAEHAVFDFLDDQIQEKKVDARVFALGIGDDVSHTLVEGVARAGRGFAQFVTQTEETDRKVVRMLKGALYAHTNDYSLEVHYKDDARMDQCEDDFELVEKPSDGLVVRSKVEDEYIDPSSAPANGEHPDASSTLARPISFFDDTATNKDDEEMAPPSYSHLPDIPAPKVLQAPASISPLYPSNRSTVYLLLGPESSQKRIKSLTLKAISPVGPLELNIAVQEVTASRRVDLSGGIHILAARKAIQDLEEGRGWLHSATVQDPTVAKTEKSRVFVKDKYPSRFDEMVEREAVRLGVKYQVAAKHTSFVAVQDNGSESGIDQDGQLYSQPEDDHVSRANVSQSLMAPGGGGAMRLRMSAPRMSSNFSQLSKEPGPSARPATFSMARISSGGALSGGLGGASSGTSTRASRVPGESTSFRLARSLPSPAPMMATTSLPPSQPVDKGSVLHQIISLQKFSGAWTWSEELSSLLKSDSAGDIEKDVKFEGEPDLATTARVVAYLQSKMSDDREVWEMVVEKAKSWIGSKIGLEKVDEVVGVADAYL
jgi:hypothetical protein